MEAEKVSAMTPSGDFVAGARLRGQEQTPLESGKEGRVLLHRYGPCLFFL